jgi:PAS domain S-box-containing protein
MSNRLNKIPRPTRLAPILLAALLSAAGACRAGDAPEVRAGSELDFRPYCFTDKNGQPTGFGVDLLRAVADKMGLRLRITPGPWDQVWNKLVAGELDVLPVVARTAGREPLVDFSLPHTETFDAFFGREDEPPIKDIAGAAGKQIVVLREDAAHHQLVERKFTGQVIPVESIPDGLRRIAAGEHDAFLCSKLIGSLEIEEHKIGGLAAGPPIPDYKRVFSFAVKKGNTELVEKLNQGLRIVKTSGEYDRIYSKWLAGGDRSRTWDYAWPVAVLLLALAAIAAVWRLSRGAAEWDDRLLQALTPRWAWSVPAVSRYALALVAVAAATALRWALIPGLGTIAPYNVWIVSAAGVTALLGIGPGLVFVVLGAAAVEVFVVGSLPVMFEAAALARIGVSLFVGVGVCVPLHAARVAAQKAREHAARLRTQVARMPIGCVVCDAHNCFSQMNPAAEAIFGYTEAELRGKHANVLVPEAAHPQVDTILHRLAQGDMTAHSVNENVTKDGRTVLCQWNNTPLRDETGRFIGTLSMVQDVTAREQAEDALRAANLELAEFNAAMVGRELRMVELKRELNALCAAAGQPPRYDLDFGTASERFSGGESAAAGAAINPHGESASEREP